MFNVNPYVNGLPLNCFLMRENHYFWMEIAKKTWWYNRITYKELGVLPMVRMWL